MFHDEAEVDEDEEEEEEEGDDEGELIGPEDEEALDAVPAARELDSRRRIREIMDQDEEEIERYYQERYETQNYVDRFGDGEAMADSIVQKERLPGIKDPNLWALRCKMGEEKAVVLALMRKFIAYQFSDTPLQIKSAFAKEGLKGYIYIEAFKQTHVKQAIEGMTALRLSRYKQQLVPIGEMTEVMRVVKESGQLREDQWVRIKSGLYRDDLALVEYVEDAQNLVSLKLIPRIDYDRRRSATGADDLSDTGKVKRFKRPPQALFTASKALDRIQRDGSWTVFEGNRYDSDGFLHKQFRMSAVVSEGIRPTLAELERFHHTQDSIQLAAVAASAAAVSATVPAGGGSDAIITHCFAPGDVVEVCEGDLKNLRGKVVSLESNNRIIVQPSHSDLHEPIPFTPIELRKFFNQGDHVKVLSGRHVNQTGLVIRFEPSLAVVLSDHSMNEMKVAPKDLRLWQDRATTLDSSGHVQMMDLVQVDPQTVGVVVNVEPEQISVFTCFGKVVTLKANTALRRLNTQRRRPPQAMDRNGNLIQLKQTVRLLEKPYCGLVGEVKHLYRSWAFIYSRTHLENAGLVVAQTRQLAVLNSTQTPEQQRGLDEFRTITPIGGAGNVGPEDVGGPGGRGRGDRTERKLIGKTARIVKGTLKGLLGIICDATLTHVVLELHSQFKKVPVARENVALLDSGGRIMDTQYGAATPRVTPLREMRTPQLAYGAQTPHAACTTPRGDSTPLPSAFNAGLATPKLSNLDDPMTPSSKSQMESKPDHVLPLDVISSWLTLCTVREYLLCGSSSNLWCFRWSSGGLLTLVTRRSIPTNTVPMDSTAITNLRYQSRMDRLYVSTNSGLVHVYKFDPDLVYLSTVNAHKSTIHSLCLAGPNQVDSFFLIRLTYLSSFPLALKMASFDFGTIGVTNPTRRIAIDCEFVGVGYEGKENALARVSIVNQFGHQLLDAYVRPKERITDYRTPYSGIRPADLRPGGPARSFTDVHQEVAKLCKGRILVGHSISNDLKVLMLSHPRRDIRDTSRYRPFRALFSGRTPSLRKLTEKVLGVQVQTGEHDSLEDARAAMRLYTSVKRVWESNKKGLIPFGSTGTRNVSGFSCQPSVQPQSDQNCNVIGINLLSEYEAGIDPDPATMASAHGEQISSSSLTATSLKPNRWDPNRHRRCSKKRTNFLRKRQKRSRRPGSTGFQSARM
ncbi:transcription elongation factor SPT5 [Paragonimus westermani]|uniref:RNA exonuclease 4 n=1 Tax=Paragonimus westermani TaxID=34504 RepID=A0A5J4NG06_9TREM|nr:transcription elongation factor SPT5 [Paragonimus westermani]